MPLFSVYIVILYKTHPRTPASFCKLNEQASLSLTSLKDRLSHEVAHSFQVSDFEHLRTDFEVNQEKQLSLMDQFHPTVIQNNLKVAILEADEESEKIVEEFLDSEL